MPQLNLNFTDMPVPETRVWNQLDEARQQSLIEALARLIEQAARIDNGTEETHD